MTIDRAARWLIFSMLFPWILISLYAFCSPSIQLESRPIGDRERITVFNHLTEQFDYETKHKLLHNERSYANDFALVDTEEKVSRQLGEHVKLQEGLDKQIDDIMALKTGLELSIDRELYSLREQINNLESKIFDLEEPILSPRMTAGQGEKGLRSLRDTTQVIKRKEKRHVERNKIY